jgi:hypothetical protein
MAGLNGRASLGYAGPVMTVATPAEPPARAPLDIEAESPFAVASSCATCGRTECHLHEGAS